MDILKASTDWAKAEVFSSLFFIMFGVSFLLATLGFYQLGKTEIAKAYIIPTLIAGSLVLIIGLGLFYANKTRINEFETAYKASPSAFLQSEITRAENTLNEYQTIVFKAIPVIIIACALGITFFNTPIWRTSMITIIAMMAVILLVDGTAHARIDNYHKQLVLEANAEQALFHKPQSQQP
ncbi:hypothetical protein DS885_02560 [Psychromonas sp. B3M02]|uniref:heparan-alpha-glucosaminide N-acetyltransferase domain-containing protein n=1 Tax=Psychromonas sp. B3M02 TaxID=2267226 RepID=UPI000DE9CDE1|nr:heparan-alpha-glucosaminide N-acetyltransferase domain-containing protein [Psychromonas sp. B3M02]RBW47543.1 hypothetical protein DS885_02560 [Psychromonas sp. B3M02]